MKVLFDHGEPRAFVRLLVGHEVRTTFQMGWAKFLNVAMLSAAAGSGFDGFVTVDRDLAFQQDTGELPLKAVALVARDNKPRTLVPLAAGVLNMVNSELHKRVYVVGLP